ncbi:hypothetical protein [Streptacidiphilus rugosus]|uniref:hypothetical protein n=1 Tax=Streptacidiphilus rugosus TaxID=405783 RepID=UPI00056CD268|nr:hypothetical protein [Streptacidiphilus rugosus]
MDLYLPEELVAQVASRLRRRVVLGLVLSALIAGPWLGYLVGMFVAGLHDPAVSRMDFQAVPFPGASGFALIAAPGIAITLLEGVWEVARARREAATVAGLLAEPAVAVRLRHAVPLWLIWAARVLAVLPALVAAGACAVQGRAGLALGFAALAPLGWLVAWSVERLQLWMLNGRRLAGRVGLLPQQAAFDDAFRVTMALPLLPLAPCLGVLAGGFYIHLVGHGFWYQDLMLAWGLSVFPIMVLNGLLTTNWAKRYHHRGARKPPAPAPAAR